MLPAASRTGTARETYCFYILRMKSEVNPISKSKKKQRLDQILVERGLVETREKARRLIMAGEVLVDEQVSDKPGRSIAVDAVIRVRALPPYVSRGGLKLAAALEAFHVDVSGLTVIDVGASTGGFSDCLLQHGAERIFAVDVGYGQLAWKLRSDQRVVVLERTNIRYLSELPGGEVADMAVIDASFISLALVLPPTLALLSPIANLIALIKPQFEAGKGQVGKGGVVRDEQVHHRVLNRISELALSLNLEIAGLIASPLLGPAGNVEFLVWLSRNPDLATDGADAIDQALSQARTLRAAKKS